MFIMFLGLAIATLTRMMMENDEVSYLEGIRQAKEAKEESANDQN